MTNLETLEALYERLPALPWRFDASEYGYDAGVVGADGEQVSPLWGMKYEGATYPNQIHASEIVEIVNTVPALIAELRAARADVELVHTLRICVDACIKPEDPTLREYAADLGRKGLHFAALILERLADRFEQGDK